MNIDEKRMVSVTAMRDATRDMVEQVEGLHEWAALLGIPGATDILNLIEAETQDLLDLLNSMATRWNDERPL